MLIVLKKIYDYSPIILQHVFTSVKGYQLKKRRYNKLYYYYLKYFNELNDVTKEKEEQIKKLLIHLKYNIPYYKKYLINIPDNQLDESVLLNLPIITKEELRENIEIFIDVTSSNNYVAKTGGTTGKSLNVFSSKEDAAKRMAYLDYFKQIHGVAPFTKRASFTGKEIIPVKQEGKIFWRYNLPLKQMLYSGFHVSEENIKYYIKSLNKFKPLALDGFPSSIYRIARYINRNNIKLDFQPYAIFPTAETLHDYYKKEIEKAFKCPVRNQYASSEGAPFITECQFGRLHFNIETGYFNLKEYNKKEDLYELIVTSFINYTTPIVQYEIGDIVEYQSTQQLCECGNKSQYEKKILGRQSDYLISEKNGQITSANMSNVAKEAPNSVIASQFVQKKINELVVNLIVDENHFKENDQKKIIQSLKYRFGNEVNIKFNIVDEIPKEKSGKTLFIKNLME